MKQGGFLSISEQIADHLREEIARGKWGGGLPGVHALASEIGVNFKTVTAALRKLEEEGLVVRPGSGKRRQIAIHGTRGSKTLVIGILHADEADIRLHYLVELQHLLMNAGHSVRVVRCPLMNRAGGDGRTNRIIRGAEVNAWIVLAGSQELLKWMIGRGFPTFAMFGRRRRLQIAGVGPDKLPAVAQATRKLIELGHRRVAMICRPARRLPQPGAAERVFLEELGKGGIEPSSYHLPHWEDNPESLHQSLSSLFALTPPTALLVDEVELYTAVQHFLSNRGIRVPADVSLICTDSDPSFEWCRPKVTRIAWDSGPVVRRIVRWADNISRGKKDLRQTATTARFVEGETIGPPKPGI
ncbi:LacI family transcriptional regulator [Haloferula helveola]|uniref:LacI family transcriptional regulator n=1 Tax=Haloferula helveola TaxID=490095 RepID=A0ABM7RDC3_9BACT|nr:LacI family transcriptional regulator [Haloferula helveola]